MDAILVNNLSFKYYRSTHEFKIDHIAIKAGEKIFLHGPSGSGKSTLLGLLCGILRPQSGSIKILNQEIIQQPATLVDKIRGQHMGYIFQSLNLLPYLTAYQNIRLSSVFSTSKKNRTTNIQQEIEDLCRSLDIFQHLHVKASNLSVGQQQRVAVARALLGSPEIIFADEPTSALDEDNKNIFNQLLLKLCRERNSTLLYVSHDPRVSQMMDRSIHVKDVFNSNYIEGKR
jgi:putative ABC transport system ATP-binding protein